MVFKTRVANSPKSEKGMFADTLVIILEQCSPTFCMCGQLTQGKHQRRLAGWSSEIGRARLGWLSLAGCLSELLAWLAAWLGWLLVCLSWLGLAGPGWAWLWPSGQLAGCCCVAFLSKASTSSKLVQTIYPPGWRLIGDIV